MQKISALLHHAGALLPKSETSHLDCRLLLQHVFDCSATWLLAHDDTLLTESQYNQFMQLIKARQTQKPIAYLIGECEFWGLSLQVNESVLVPRPDTETLVETALSFVRNRYQHQLIRILDLGAGSGAIGLALASECANAQVVAVEKSTRACKVAKLNQQNLDVVNYTLLQSDWFASIEQQRFHLIVSNPPYIAEHDPHLQQGAVQHEPISALVSMNQGLSDIEHIIQQSPKYLYSGAGLFIEHGYQQAHFVRACMQKTGFAHIASYRDLQFHQRVTGGVFG